MGAKETTRPRKLFKPMKRMPIKAAERAAKEYGYEEEQVIK